MKKASRELEPDPSSFSEGAGTQTTTGMMEPSHQNVSSCSTNLTADHFYSSIVISAVSFISLILSVVAVVFSVLEYCWKNKISIERTERLFVYLAILAMMFSFGGCFQWIALFSTSNNTTANAICEMVAFVWMYFSTGFVVITLCVGIHFLLLMCRPKCLQVIDEEKEKKFKRIEALYCAFAVSAAIVWSPLPFINNRYGYNFWICWIKTTKDDCGMIIDGLIETSIFYMSCFFAMAFSLVVIIIMLSLIYCRKRKVNSPRTTMYIWIFFAYLSISLVILIATFVVNFFDPKIVPPAVNAIKLASLPLVPMTLAIVTIVALCLNKHRQVKKQKSLSLHTEHRSKNYGSVNVIDSDDIDDYLVESSRAPTTYWNPPKSTIEDL